MVLLEGFWSYTLTDCIQAASAAISLWIIIQTRDALQQQIKANSLQREAIAYQKRKDILDNAPIFRFMDSRVFMKEIFSAAELIELEFKNLGRTAYDTQLYAGKDLKSGIIYKSDLVEQNKTLVFRLSFPFAGFMNAQMELRYKDQFGNLYSAEIENTYFEDRNILYLRIGDASLRVP